MEYYVRPARSARGTFYAFVVFILTPCLLHAQTGDTKNWQLEEIIVTAQKREANVQTVPISISVFDGAALEKGGVARLEDFTDLAPNVYINFNDSIRATSISMRGILSDPNNVGIDQAVGVYVDGVYMARPTTINVGMFDLERVEILRGPQGTIFGKNTIAGVIHFISRKPADVAEASATVRLGNFDYKLFNAMGNLPISDAIALRGSMQYEKRDGFLKNLAGPDNNDLDNFNARIGLRFAPNDDVEVLIRADAARDRTHAGANEVLVPSALFAGPPFNSPQDVDPWDRIIKDSESSHQDRDLFGTSAEINWSVGPGTFTSLTAYREFDWDNFQTSDSSEFDIFGTGILEDENQVSQEFRYAGGDDQFNYVAGLYYFEQTMDAQAVARIGVDVFAPFGFPLGSNPAPGIGYIEIHTENKSYAAFAQLDYSVTESLVLTGGLRYTTEDKKITHALFGDPTGAFVPTVPKTSFSRSDDEPSWLAGIKFFASDQVMVYGTYSRGFKAGGYNAFSFSLIQSDGSPADFEPEFVDNFELGLKSTLANGRLQLNAAVFNMDYQDLQVNQLIPNNFGIIDFVTSNAAKAKSQGFEIELLARPTEYLTLQAGYGFTDAEYSSFPGATPSGDDYSGNTLPYSPKHSFGGAFDYGRPITGSWSFIIRGEYVYRSERYSDAANTPEFKGDSYSLVNGRIGLIGTNNGLGINAWVRNLFDKDYAIQIGPGGAFSPGAVYMSVGNERTYGLELVYHWGAE
jgi:iron complex outermembrane receptor protein